MKIGWSNKSIFKELRAEAQMLSERAFERRALSLLRVRHPHLVAPPQRLALDRAGIDLIDLEQEPPYRLVVQCKGFDVANLGDRQIKQALKSIAAFQQSGLKAKLYLFVHNRLSRDQVFREVVGNAVKTLIETGAAESAALWDVDALVKQTLDGLFDRMAVLARDSNLSVVKEYASAEPALCPPLEDVALRSDELVVDQHRLRQTKTGPERVADPVAEILANDVRLSLLVGYAGFGKTTATLRLTQRSDIKTFFVPAARISKLTTTDILSSCVDIDSLVAGFQEDDRTVLRRAAQLVIDVFFAKDAGSYLLLIDGLDECAVLETRGGLQDLLNALRPVGSKIVLTVRKEFLESRTADFADSMGRLVSDRPHTRRHTAIRQVELLPWDDSAIAMLVKRFADTKSGLARQRLQKLANSVDTGGYRTFYGDIPRRPLFLRFILETVSERGVHTVTRAELFEEWAVMKIARDVRGPSLFGGHRQTIANEASVDDTIELSFEAMSWAARMMVAINDGKLVLLGDCSASQLLSLPQLRDKPSVEGLILNSLLVPIGPRRSPHPMQLRFAHRTYQEYFLARFLRAHPDTFHDVALPAEIAAWMS